MKSLSFTYNELTMITKYEWDQNMRLKVCRSLIKKKKVYNLLKEIIKKTWKHAEMKNLQLKFSKNYVFWRNCTLIRKAVSEILKE